MCTHTAPCEYTQGPSHGPLPRSTSALQRMRCDREPDSPLRPEGPRASVTSRRSQTLTAPNILFGEETAPDAAAVLRLSAPITAAFSIHLHASIHLAELEVNCHHPLRFREGGGGGEEEGGVFQINISFL